MRRNQYMSGIRKVYLWDTFRFTDSESQRILKIQTRREVSQVFQTRPTGYLWQIESWADILYDCMQASSCGCGELTSMCHSLLIWSRGKKWWWLQCSHFHLFWVFASSHLAGFPLFSASSPELPRGKKWWWLSIVDDLWPLQRVFAK